MSHITIGKLARQTELTVETIRYYERRGLLPTPRRSPAGYRLYPPDAVSRLRFIRRARELQFSLDEISRLLRYRDRGAAECGVVESMARKRLGQLGAQIHELREAKQRLEHLVARCERGDACAIMRTLEDGDAADPR